jgi:hypothetical protein
MPIHEEALGKLQAADKLCAQTFVMTMEQILGIRDQMGCPGDAQITLDYQGAGMEVKNGDLIPFITIGLRQVVIEDN